MKTIKIHMIRHGLTQANLQGLYSGHSDVALCPQGVEQIEKMKKEMEYPKTQYVFSSPLERAKETCKLIYPDVPYIILNDLIEYNFGDFEGRDAEELHEKAPLFDRWLRGEEGVAPPFGESNEEFVKRVCDCFVKLVDGLIKTNVEEAVVITHGGVIATILSNIALPEGKVHQWLAPAGCGFTLRVQPELWMSVRKLEVIDEVPYSLEQNKNYYDGWDYYPEEDDYDITRDVYEDFDPHTEGRI